MDPREKNRLFQAGIEAFNTLHFFEAHEHWEEVWLRTPLPEKLYLQGLIQIAAAFHHRSQSNLDGAKSLLRAGLIKLEPCPATQFGIDVQSLREAARGWLIALDEGVVSQEFPLPRVLSCP